MTEALANLIRRTISPLSERVAFAASILWAAARPRRDQAVRIPQICPDGTRIIAKVRAGRLQLIDYAFRGLIYSHTNLNFGREREVYGFAWPGLGAVGVGLVAIACSAFIF